MLKFTSCIILVLINVSQLTLAQGFDWQFSSRMPTKHPSIFIGPSVEFSFFSHGGSFKFFEETQECCSFKNAQDIGFNFGVSAEYWLTAKSAVYAAVSYFALPGKFIAETNAPISRDTLLITEYNFDSKLKNISLILGIKARLLGTYSFVAVDLQSTYISSANFAFTEKVISPDNFYFNTDPPTQVRAIANGNISGLNRIIITPGFRMGYDLNLGNGIYSSLSIGVRYSLNSIANDDNWRYLQLSAGINIYRGFFPK